MTRVAAALQAIGSVVREAADMRDPVQYERATPMRSSGKVRARMVGAMYGVRESRRTVVGGAVTPVRGVQRGTQEREEAERRHDKLLKDNHLKVHIGNCPVAPIRPCDLSQGHTATGSSIPDAIPLPTLFTSGAHAPLLRPARGQLSSQTGASPSMK